MRIEDQRYPQTPKCVVSGEPFHRDVNLVDDFTRMKSERGGFKKTHIIKPSREV